MISNMIGRRPLTWFLLKIGGSVNILPKGVYDAGPLGVLQTLFIKLSLADGPGRRTHGIVEDVIMKVKNCYLPVDFIIVDMKTMKDSTSTPIILGRPFMATTKVITDCGK